MARELGTLVFVDSVAHIGVRTFDSHFARFGGQGAAGSLGL